ncbi:MAG: hypothetical protein IKP77_02020 [Acholeplasmatales bacterium]|nr:hypothetical protein [Acholeplasmatales bacterium]
MTPLINTLIQVGIFVLSIYVVGFIISLINKLFYKIAGTSKAVIYTTGIIGTPIHELSHALFCIIFLHKITEMKLFQINSEDGTLGYVNHSYNRRNIYHIIGNFFIGVAPILVGTTILILLMKLMVPSVFDGIVDSINSFVKVCGNEFVFSEFFKMLGNIFVTFFKGATDWVWWIYFVICFFIALHMNLSKADLKGTVIAIPFIIVIIACINFILYYVSTNAYNGYLNGMWIGGMYLLIVLLSSLLYSGLSLGFAVVIGLIRKAGKK